MEAEIRTTIGVIIFALLLSFAGCYEEEEYLRTLEVNNE
jgi:hypothetical protein